MEWSLGGPLSELCLMTTRQPRHGDISRHSFNIGPYWKNVLKIFSWNCLANWDQTLVEWSLGCPLSEIMSDDSDPSSKMPHQLHSFNIGPYWKNVLKIFSETAWPIWDQTLVEWSLVVLSVNHVSNDPASHPRWPPSADIVFNIGPMAKCFKNLLYFTWPAWIVLDMLANSFMSGYPTYILIQVGRHQ